MLRVLPLFLIALIGCAQRPPAPSETAALTSPAPSPSIHRAIPLEDFFRNPALAGYKVSPNGEALALFKSVKNRMNLFVHPVNSPAAIRQLTFFEDRDISRMTWKGSDYLIFSKDVDGDENDHVFAVNVHNGILRDLTPFKGVKATLVDDLEESSNTDILIEHNDRSKEAFDLYRINVTNGSSRLLVENDYKINTWLVDHTGKVRGGTAHDGVTTVLYYAIAPGQPFAAILNTDFRNSFHPIGFTADNKNIYALTNLQRDLDTLVEVNPRLPSPRMIVKTRYADPKYDLSDAEYSYARKDIGYVIVVTDRRETYFLDAADQKDWEELKARFPQEGLVLSNASKDDRFWVFKTLSDRTRGAFYIYDRQQKSLQELGKVSPWLNPDAMAEMKTVHYQTRDGLVLEGYLTMPKGSSEHRIPVVINPHGGPWSRDDWGFNPEVQFLANRGYAVLRVNYRGSTGYGRKFWEASFKQWGKKMQDDLTDGVHWLIDQGVADPKRVAVYGGSYGGYAALAGITLTPDLYACAVDYVGVANLFTFLKTIPPYWKPYLDMFTTMVGDPVRDKVLLTAVSPVFHVDHIKAPLFIAQGANDPRVNKNESDQMVEALHKRGIAVQYMVKNNEGHGFRNEENRFDFYRAMEKFLAKHLSGPK